MLNRSGDWGLRRTVFWAAGRCEEAAQKVVLEQTPCALAGAAVLHNVIIGQRNTNT
jgi:hypothetical protein